MIDTMDQFGLDKQPKKQVLSVSQLNREARRLLETGLPMAWVEGELSNIARPGSGHWYFTLKDSSAQIRCAMFKNRNQYAQIQPREGQAVLVRGRVSLYEARGDYQLIAENIQDAGEGLLQQKFEVLKKMLNQEGLFDAESKRALPALPERIGLITSPTGAAIRDVLSVLKRRFPGVPVRVYPVAVQGDAAATQIRTAIREANRRADCDVLMLTRGGGSIEDLWPFNEELVARAIYASRLPIVSAVGHETDITISDFVADLRAPTPSAAAELLVPDASALRNTVIGLERRLERGITAQLDNAQEQLTWLSGRHQQCRPDLRIAQHAQRLDDVDARLHAVINLILSNRQNKLTQRSARLAQNSPQNALITSRNHLTNASQKLLLNMQQRLTGARSELSLLSSTLHAVSPQATMERGYSIVVKDNSIVSSSKELDAGDELQIRLAQGAAEVVVKKTG